MAALLNLQVLGLSIIFVAPGVVASTVFNYLYPAQSERKLADYSVELITFSAFYLTLFFWLIGLLYNPIIQKDALLYNFLALVAIFIVPAVLGWFASVLLSATWLRRLAGTVIHPVPGPWDYIFRRNKFYWVIFHLKTGESFGGLYKDKSFASQAPDANALYVQEVWKLDDAGRFVEKIGRTAGAYVRIDECTFIEFLT